MRTLNDYFLFGGSFTAIQTAGNTADEIAVVPDGGKVIGVAINVHTIIDAETTFDILVNGADSTADAVLPDATPDETGVVMEITGTALVNPGDALQLQSNGEQVAATTADITWIIRR
jgi:hypothetical protein